MLTTEQMNGFHTAGYVHLESAVSGSVVDEMRTRVWNLMSPQGFLQYDPASWRIDGTSSKGFKPVPKLGDMKVGETSPEDCVVVREALDEIFEAGRATKDSWGQPLVTMPNGSDTWLMPTSIWHFDHRYSHPRQINGANVFLLIDDVEAGGGGTAVVRNSPLLLDRLLNSGAIFSKLSEQNKGFCNSHPWLRGLKANRKSSTVERNRQYMDQDADIDGIPARVEELTGAAGDVFLCHPALLHAPAMNTSSRPRLMRTQRFYSTAIQEYLQSSSAKAR
jgi:ectoine hydroxylase-related dioxygenase (phytanoyl-CoA dioxygenase family)